jgi:hypothetical protein
MSPGPHIVHVDRKKNFTSSTLAPDVMQRLESAFRAVPWWRDRWADRRVRDTALAIVRELGGLVLIGPGMRFENPEPFNELFEPIEIARPLGDETERLKTLSGAAPTRQERITWFLAIFGWVAGVALIVLMILALFRGLPIRIAAVFGGAFALVICTLGLVVTLQRLGGRWYLVPGGLAIVRRPIRRGQPARVTVLSRADAGLTYRYVSSGKTTILVLELWTHLGKRFRRSVSEREAMSVLAAWQSSQAPPPDERLQELSW